MRHLTLRQAFLAALMLAALFTVLPVPLAQAADLDNDGIDDSVDPCLSPPAGSCLDADKDNFPDHLDNCVNIYNPSQQNRYGDTRGDACEAETGARLNHEANKIIAYQITGATNTIHFYSAASKKLGATTTSALQSLANGGAGASTTFMGENGLTLRLTFNGQNTFTIAAINSDGSTGDSSQFPFTVATQASNAATTSTTTTPQTYVVQAGDTLTRIASRFGTTVSALVSANNLSNPNLLRIGQVLTIP